MHNLSTPKITVLMPVYNCELYIREAVDSILNQTFADFEILIIDDASTDKTADIIKTYNDERIKLIVKPLNTGLTNSLNYGLQVAKGEYIARMDGDDISLPERFAKQVAFLDANPDVVLCGSWFSIIGSGDIIKVAENNDSIKLDLLKGSSCIAHPSVMMKKQTLDEFSIVYDVTKEPAEDYDLWVRLIAKGKFYNLQEVLLNYRVHHSQVSQIRRDEQLNSALESLLVLFNYLDFEKTAWEYDVLIKIIKTKEILEFNEILAFQMLRDKLIVANTSGFFDVNGFKQYLSEIENKIVENYFIKRNSYSPSIYFQYLKIKKRCHSKLTTFNVVKLVIKSLLLHEKEINTKVPVKVK